MPQQFPINAAEQRKKIEDVKNAAAVMYLLQIQELNNAMVKIVEDGRLDQEVRNLVKMADKAFKATAEIQRMISNEGLNEAAVDSVLEDYDLDDETFYHLSERLNEIKINAQGVIDLRKEYDQAVSQSGGNTSAQAVFDVVADIKDCKKVLNRLLS